MGEECGFSFVSFFDSDVVVTPMDVYNCELGAPAEVVYVSQGGLHEGKRTAKGEEWVCLTPKSGGMV